jgi:hypothetical protein
LLPCGSWLSAPTTMQGSKAGAGSSLARHADIS